MPGGATVMLNEYAFAVDGTGHRELRDCMANVRVALAARLGGPKPAGNVPSRVSAIRQGVTATNASELAGVSDNTVASLLRTLNSPNSPVTASLSAPVGCQYNGAGQFFSGTVSCCSPKPG